MKKEILSIVQLIVAAIIIGVMVWFSTQNSELEIPELTDNLCPVDERLIKTRRIVLYDFSDPLPAQYTNYPQQVLDELINNETNQFDKITLYTFNPYDNYA